MIWVPAPVVTIIHDRQISRHGGAAGIRDQGALEAACARPLNKHAHGEDDLASLAAAYAFGLAKAHAFVDGNKRTAFVTSVTFLRLNGVSFRPDPREGVKLMVDLASGEVNEEEFGERLRVKWLRLSSKD